MMLQKVYISKQKRYYTIAYFPGQTCDPTLTSERPVVNLASSSSCGHLFQTITYLRRRFLFRTTTRMAKRAANNYLTDQNWDDEEEQVEVRLCLVLYYRSILD